MRPPSLLPPDIDQLPTSGTRMCVETTESDISPYECARSSMSESDAKEFPGKESLKNSLDTKKAKNY